MLAFVLFLASKRFSHSPPLILASRRMASSTSAADQWSDQAALYSNQASRITELHGADLVTLLKDDILQAKTILDVGCGTGAFSKAYLQQFPKGIPNQTLILSDLSAGMLEKAKETVLLPSDNSFQTTIIFQEEDGTKLDGIADDSIDLVVSLFGVFLIPDQGGVASAITRVMRPKTGVFANASWIFRISEELGKLGFGASLQDVFQITAASIDIDPEANNKKLENTSFYAWADPGRAKAVLVSDMYKLENVEAHSALHTTVWDFSDLMTMLEKNPTTNLQTASDEDKKKAKDMLTDFLTQHGGSIEKPLMLSTASIFSIGRAPSN